MVVCYALLIVVKIVKCCYTNKSKRGRGMQPGYKNGKGKVTTPEPMMAARPVQTSLEKKDNTSAGQSVGYTKETKNPRVVTEQDRDVGARGLVDYGVGKASGFVQTKVTEYARNRGGVVEQAIESVQETMVPITQQHVAKVAMKGVGRPSAKDGGGDGVAAGK